MLSLGLLTIVVLILTWISSWFSGASSNTLYRSGGKDAGAPPAIVIGDIKTTATYDENKNPSLTSIHIGQRKLLMNEIQFMSEIDDERPLIVYAGAAPGNKTGYLSKLFPNMTLLLVDPNKFDVFDATPVFLPLETDAAVKKMLADAKSRIFIINTIYTNELSKALAAINTSPYTSIHFISDIRTSTDDINVLWNLAQQYNWIKLLEPASAMLKFRHIYYTTPHAELVKLSKQAPYAADFALACELGLDLISGAKRRVLPYFSGQIRLQPWAPRTSTETRLVLRACSRCSNTYPLTDYDDTYENTMHGYNAHDRVQRHVNDNADLRVGFDHCNDCALENHIWKQYIASRKGRSRNVISYVKEVSALTRRGLLRDKHGLLA